VWRVARAFRSGVGDGGGPSRIESQVNTIVHDSAVGVPGSVWLIAVTILAGACGRGVSGVEWWEDGFYQSYTCGDGDLLEIVSPSKPGHSYRWRKGDQEWIVVDVVSPRDAFDAEDKALASCPKRVLFEVEGPLFNGSSGR